MLRSEVDWFPRFLAICQCHLEWWITEGETDYDTMKRILRCEHLRQVQDVLNDYKDEDFSHLVHTKQTLAQKLVAREKRHWLRNWWLAKRVSRTNTSCIGVIISRPSHE